MKIIELINPKCPECELYMEVILTASGEQWRCPNHWKCGHRKKYVKKGL